jgi:hypothetical protein
VETTLGNPGDLLVFRRARDQPDGKLGWRPIRKGVADLPETSEAAPPDVRRIAARVGRQIRLLRAHGLVQKIPKTHRYQLTAKGHALTAALTAARTATLEQLLREAA